MSIDINNDDPTIRDVVIGSGENARDKGFHDNHLTLGDRLALIHSEVSEALEAYRTHGHTQAVHDQGQKPEGVPSELADVVIRIADLCYVEAIDLGTAIVEKMAFNTTREHMHGGKTL